MMFLRLVTVGAAIAPAFAVPLNEWPMIMTHDAGTGYFSGGTCSLLHPVNDWAQTQPTGGFANQLDCGARALDLRMYVESGQLEMHHASVHIDKKFSDALTEVKAWVSQNPNELVLLYASHCDGQSDDDKKSCHSKVQQAFKDAGIYELQCNSLKDMTVELAMTSGSVGSGKGSVVGLLDCGMAENYDSSITCYGDILAEQQLIKNGTLSAPEASYVCYGDDSDKAFNKFWTYMSKTVSSMPSDGRLWMAQAHWQYDAKSIAQGTLHGSCILEDESKAKVHDKLIEKINAGTYPHMNILEVNNICDGGNELLHTLRTHYHVASVDSADRAIVI
eukprot:CAMPEP_0206488706 /NCGR_PEP_ID=MMETSP0324_2-20121206/42618_1 /ASSEMBLY_ACC=CAM_ASM_000836 /TAXON_ID=2866 /ORGANISM="Crypthecodinium cohnii, Strain Seligo" /LENGTH=332 /DNA_ID=CAMNT_0053967873 /DNA_START=20 /DNA_END=1018 /DNA_ORIENTATION=-